MDLKELERQCGHCQRCGLATGRKHLVFGEGNPHADVLLIGEGPGEKEDELGQPFVGAAGKLLDDMLELIGLHRQDIYIANIVKCRPPNNRDPLQVEQDACLPWLRAQTKCIQPKVIVCLGRVAAQRIIAPEFKITQHHGQWYTRGNIEMMALYHPAALLRDERKRPDTFVDLKSLQLKLRQLEQREQQER